MNKTTTPRSIWQNPLHFIAFGFGSGAMPYAPGTFGTLASIPFYLLFQHWVEWAYIILTCVMVVIGIYVCGRTCREIGVHDHPGAVFDEFVGFFVTMSTAPLGWIWIIIGFSLFRLFDIWKPIPIGWIDKNMKGGFGIVLDDVVAGIYAAIVIWVLAHVRT